MLRRRTSVKLGGESVPFQDWLVSLLSDTEYLSIPCSSFVAFMPSTIHIREFSLPVILHQAGSCDLRSLPLLPALKVIQPFLTSSKQRSFQFIQPCNQCRGVLVVGILGGVHDATETANKCLREKSRITKG